MFAGVWYTYGEGCCILYFNFGNLGYGYTMRVCLWILRTSINSLFLFF